MGFGDRIKNTVITSIFLLNEWRELVCAEFVIWIEAPTAPVNWHTEAVTQKVDKCLFFSAKMNLGNLFLHDMFWFRERLLRSATYKINYMMLCSDVSLA